MTPTALLSTDEAQAIVATGDVRNVVRLAFPYADDTFADWVLTAHTGYPATLAVTDLADEIAAAVPIIEQHLVTIDNDGAVASWHPATGFTGHPAQVVSAQEAVAGKYGVLWGRLPDPQPADDATPRGALAALMDLKPGRTRIVEWPETVRDWWERTHDDCGNAHE